MFFFQAEDGIRDAHYCLEFRRVLFRSEGRGLRGEADIVPAKRPTSLRQFASQVPAPAAVFVSAGKKLTRRVPFRKQRRPHRMRFGPDETMRAELPELAAMPAVDQAIGVPAFHNHEYRLAATPSGKGREREWGG